MPFSPRWLINKGREEEALHTLAKLRNLPEDHNLVQVEFLEIKSEAEFERRIFARRFPDVTQDSTIRREIAQYVNIFRTRDSFKRVAIGSLVMFFQQWTGIDSSEPTLYQFRFELPLTRQQSSTTHQSSSSPWASRVLHHPF